jgi:hypothetical protein
MVRVPTRQVVFSVAHASPLISPTHVPDVLIVNATNESLGRLFCCPPLVFCVCLYYFWKERSLRVRLVWAINPQVLISGQNSNFVGWHHHSYMRLFIFGVLFIFEGEVEREGVQIFGSPFISLSIAGRTRWFVPLMADMEERWCQACNLGMSN